MGTVGVGIVLSGVEVVGEVMGVVGRVVVSGTTVVVSGGGLCGKGRSPYLADSLALLWDPAGHPFWMPSASFPFSQVTWSQGTTVGLEDRSHA